ncbi:hypothetical protein EDC04DRAFT_2600184 [Pisolithus marmoratus]|nr:hypothetical protein EDC04DRAFT_2600184 [Pisolithus marmoratus]
MTKWTKNGDLVRWCEERVLAGNEEAAVDIEFMKRMAGGALLPYQLRLPLVVSMIGSSKREIGSAETNGVHEELSDYSNLNSEHYQTPISLMKSDFLLTFKTSGNNTRGKIITSSHSISHLRSVDQFLTLTSDGELSFHAALEDTLQKMVTDILYRSFLSEWTCSWRWKPSRSSSAEQATELLTVYPSCWDGEYSKYFSQKTLEMWNRLSEAVPKGLFLLPDRIVCR